MDRAVSFSSQFISFCRRHSFYLLALGLLLLAMQDIFGTHGVLAMRRSQREAREIQEHIKQLSEENKQLNDHIQELKSDPEAIEHIAREERHLAKPGELVFTYPVKPPGTANLAPAAPKTPDRK
ncbi:MAG: FtsB family cell division protein [Candidatus Acidiferrales bacterium]